MGINNDGVDICVERLKETNAEIIIGGNIGKNTTTKNENASEDYLTNFKKLHPYVDYFVLNVSCPNVSNFTKLQDVEFEKPSSSTKVFKLKTTATKTHFNKNIS